MARFDRLTELLSSLGEENLKIRKVILVKSLLFAEPSKGPEQEESDPEEPLELPRNVGTLVYEAMKSHPNIFEPEQIHEEKDEEADGSRDGFFVKGSFYSYRIHLRKRSRSIRPWIPQSTFQYLAEARYSQPTVRWKDYQSGATSGMNFGSLLATRLRK
jgi:hypothetical protein